MASNALTSGEQVLCRIFLLSTDLAHIAPAYERIVQSARRRGLAGATVIRGILGFGSRSISPPTGIWHISTPTPVIVELVDSASAIRAFLTEEVLPALKHGTITLERAGVLFYRHRTSTTPREPLQLLARVNDLSTLPDLAESDLMKNATIQAPHDGILLRIFAGESDVYGTPARPLHEAIVAKARELGLAGATVLRGSMGFGANSVLHTSKVLDLSTDLPIVIELVDSEEKIRALLPVLDGMIEEGMITMESVRILAYRHNPADGPQRK